jgi:hypothetical protein
MAYGMDPHGSEHPHGFIEYSTVNWNDCMPACEENPSTRGWTRKMLRALQVAGFGVFLAALGAVNLYYRFAGGDTTFECFMDSQGFGVRFLFTTFGVINSLFWGYTRNGMCSFPNISCFFHCLLEPPRAHILPQKYRNTPPTTPSPPPLDPQLTAQSSSHTTRRPIPPSFTPFDASPSSVLLST